VSGIASAVLVESSGNGVGEVDTSVAAGEDLRGGTGGRRDHQVSIRCAASAIGRIR